ncbi:lantibiotic dehydratase [Streptomyces sp. NPDC056956]|uniref:lantibiotic dehydratase n=1 Tax=Streptomyces sp. NPDC056956 TaxID=3345980 RepID=UPI003631A343
MALDVPRYQWTGAAVLRATTGPSTAVLPSALDLDSADAVRDWLAELWQRAEIRNALFAASPVLCQTIDGIVHGRHDQPRQLRRAALSVISYLLRWQHRPAPFGLFAGTAPLTIGTTPRVRWGPRHAVTLRADGEWLSDVVRDLEQQPALLERLTIIANNTAEFRGDRLAAPGPPADGHARLMAPVEISLRATRPVKAAMEHARTPITYTALRDILTTAFPAGAGGKIDAVLQDLIEQNVLITSLRPPMTTVDALDHLCTELKRVDAHSLPDVGGLARTLYGLRDDLTAHTSPSAETDLRELTARMHRHSSIAPLPVVVDTALNCEVQLPGEVIQEVEDAVAVLHHVSPLPYGYKLWRDYHRRFRARYGVGAVVPVLDLVADSGLGRPAEYVGSERGKAPKTISDRDTVVLKLLQQAHMEGRDELVLDDAAISELAEAAGTEERLYGERSEIAFEVHAPSTHHLADGRFDIEITGVPRPGSSMLGRFAHLMPTAEQHLLTDSYVTRPDVITAQLSFSPRRRRNENVARTDRLLPYVIPLGEHPGEHGEPIPLDDVSVTADARRFHLVQVSSGRPIHVRVLHALEAGIQTPPLARFLSEVSGSRRAVYKRFDFGAAARLPYLPRVRYRRTTLAPARWLLSSKDLPGRKAPVEEWEAAFAVWRARLNVPSRVCVVEYDQRLPVDLDHPAHRRLVRSQLHEAPELELREVVDPARYGWIGRAHEILLPLRRATPSISSTPLPASRAQPVPAVQLPGCEEVLRMHLHAHPDRFDEILDRHVPRLLDVLGQPMWWFSRHRELARPEAGQHLTVTLHLPEAAAATATVNRWATDLHHQRLLSALTLEPYQPQTGRYGTGPAMDAAHRAFAADSSAALAQIRLTIRGAVLSQALTAASLVDLATHLLASEDATWDWLIQNTPAHGRPDRTVRVQAIQLYATRQRLAEHGVAELGEGWAVRSTALAKYRKALITAEREPTTVLRSLLHHHHVRAMGVGPATEAATLHLARTIALRHRPVKAPR